MCAYAGVTRATALVIANTIAGASRFAERKRLVVDRLSIGRREEWKLRRRRLVLVVIKSIVDAREGSLDEERAPRV